MREYLAKVLDGGNNLTTEDMVLHVIVSCIIGFVIFLSYKLSHTGTIYSKKFNVSLVLLSTLTGMVMTVIGNNVALSLGMVGALSIVRFRTPIKDSRDTVYIFWAIIVGICCGVGDYTIAVIGSAVVFLITLILGRVKNDDRILIIVKGSMNVERNIEAVIFKYFSRKAVLRVKNMDSESVEFIYEISRKVYEREDKKNKSIVESLYELGMIEYVNIVRQNDEISG